MNNNQKKLYIFDLDGTLVDRDSNTLYPDVMPKLKSLGFGETSVLGENVCVGIATNQGGIGLRYWMESMQWGEPEKYPTLPELAIRLVNVFNPIYQEVSYPIIKATFRIRASYRYYSKSTEKWSPVPKEQEEWYSPDSVRWHKDQRKPDIGMLRDLVRDFSIVQVRKIQKSEVLFVGDMETDRQCAINFGVDYMDAKEFFER